MRRTRTWSIRRDVGGSDGVGSDVGDSGVVVGSSDVAGSIEKSLVDAQSWYEIAFDPLPADKPNEYHHIEIKVDQSGLIARTRTGYYSNPVAAGAGR